MAYWTKLKTMLNQTSNLHLICDQIGPREIGIIWLQDEELSEKTEYFFEMNYLMDGLLSQTEITDKDNFHFYLTKQFSNQFFLIYKDCSKKMNVDNLISIIKNSTNLINSERSNILIFSQSKRVNSNSLIEQLKKKFKDLEFQTITL